MPNKKEYNNFEQINLDLKILSLEKEIAYAKVLESIEDTQHQLKKSLTPVNIAKNAFESISSTYQTNKLKTMVIGYGLRTLIRWFKK